MFKHPATILVCGGTGSGKTIFVKKLMEEREHLFTKAFTKILWYYTTYQPIFDHLSHFIDFKEGFPEPNDIPPGACVVLDDQQSTLSKQQYKQLVRMFTVDSHHTPYTVIYIVHTLFDNTPEMRTIARSSHYTIFMRSPRMELTVQKFAEQAFRKGNGFLLDAYEKVTKRPFSYLLINLHPGESDSRLKVMSNVLPSEYPPHVFIPQ
jgi:hypothetical protein